MTGPRVLVTRQPEQAGALRDGLLALGAAVVEVPLIAVVPPADPAPLAAAAGALRDYDWVVFTSANAVQALAARCAPPGSWPPGPRIASVGPATAAAIRQAWPGARVALEPEADHRAEGLLQAFAEVPLSGRRALLPASERARDVLAAGLRARGAAVDVVTAYRNLPPPDMAERLEAALAAGVDLVTFASPSAVQALVEAAPQAPGRVPAAVIGPVTEAAARQAGFEVAAVAAPSTAEGLLRALAAWITAWRGAERSRR